ncbi:hypothetical protein AVEN_73090-1 [Araneus ventricosus]|uniref:BEN domain-containing protein n=1 Tax=Araneus ventricosus TaxID=182803 RepID=A0A4Y2J1R5_ARAVE|nr:hypothetical protein AVEN_73090-1 [Araneus ventricosus]
MKKFGLKAIPAAKLALCRSDYSKYVGDLLDICFGRENLSASVLKCNTNSTSKTNVLDESTIYDIMAHVMEKFKPQLCRLGAHRTTCSEKVLAAVRTLDRFGISDRADAAIVSAALQDVGIISGSNVLNVVDRNKIRRGRTKARTTLLSQVIKDYDHDQFGLYFDERKDRTLSMEDNRRKVIIEEHISLAKEPGSEYIDHVSVNFGRAQIIGNNIYSFFVMR